MVVYVVVARREPGREVLVLTDSPDDRALDGLVLHLVDVPLNAWSVAQQCVGERTQ